MSAERMSGLAIAVLAVAAMVLAVLPVAAFAASTSDSTQVVVKRGGPVEIAFTPDLTGLTSSFAASITNAVQMAVEAHPAVRGFPVQINVVNMPCGDAALDQFAAASVVGNAQNAGMIGPFCSTADAAALPILDPADVVTISGSTTNPFLPRWDRTSSTASMSPTVAVPTSTSPTLGTKS